MSDKEWVVCPAYPGLLEEGSHVRAKGNSYWSVVTDIDEYIYVSEGQESVSEAYDLNELEFVLIVGGKIHDASVDRLSRFYSKVQKDNGGVSLLPPYTEELVRVIAAALTTYMPSEVTPNGSNRD
jgi:hypothetical protein